MKTRSKLIQWITTHKILAALATTLFAFGACKAAKLLTPTKEIALIIDEPWTDMQVRSTAEIGPVFEGRNWYREPKQLSHLRFADPAHGFSTPPAKFFTVSFDENAKIRSVRMSPQVEPLPLQDTLNIVLNLQDQWRKTDWELDDAIENPPYEDNAEWRKAKGHRTMHRLQHLLAR